MRRIRLRTFMTIVALGAVLTGSVGIGRRTSRRGSCHHSRATVFGRLEQKERVREAAERILADDRRSIGTTLSGSQGFATMNSAGQERAIAAVVSHRPNHEHPRYSAR